MFKVLNSTINAGVVDSVMSGSYEPSNVTTTSVALDIDIPSLWLGVFLGALAVLIIIGLKCFIKTVFLDKEEFNNKNKEE